MKHTFPLTENASGELLQQRIYAAHLPVKTGQIKAAAMICDKFDVGCDRLSVQGIECGHSLTLYSSLDIPIRCLTQHSIPIKWTQ